MGISHVFTSPIADGTNTQLVKPSDWNSSHAYTLQDAVSLSGNTAGVLANISSGTLYLAGGNNVTLSQNGNSVTISGANVGGAQTGISGIIGSNATYTSGTVEVTGSNIVTVRSSAGQRIVIDASQSVQTQMTGLTAGMSTNGNTSGDTGLVSNRLVLIGGNNITLSGSTNGQSMSLTISGPNVGGAQTGISGISVSDTMFTSGSVSFRNANGISFGSSGAQGISASHNALTSQSTQFMALTIAGNTAGTSTFHATNNASLFFNGGNNITLSGNGSTVTIIGPNTSAQQTGISGISASNTLYTSGTVLFTGSNMITVKSSGAGQTVILDATQSVQTLGIYASSQTVGQSSSSTYDARSLSLVGDGIISLGWSAGSFRISASVSNTIPPIATTVQSVGSANSVGTVTRFAPEDHKHEGVYAAGVSNIGNTSGNTTVQPGRLVLAGGNNIVLSVSTAANALQTVTISASNVIATRVAPNFFGKLQGASQTSPQSSLYLFPLHPQSPTFGNDLTINTLNILMSGNIANSSSFTVSYSVGFYTWANSSALSLAFFATSSFARTSATNQSTAFNGIRWWSFVSSQFSNSASNATTPALNASAEYYIAHLWNSSNQSKALSWVGGSVWIPQVLSGSMGQNITSGSTNMNVHPAWGVYSTGAMPPTISATSLNATAGSIGFVPYIEIEGLVTGF